jgi:FkbM family methyltransferase
MSEIIRLMRRFAKMLRLIQSAAGRQGLRHGVGATIEHDHALKGLSFDTIVDIGANKGQFSLFCLGEYSQANIYGCEPLPGPAATYRRLFADNANVTLFEAAIGPEDGESDIHVSKRDDSSSLLPIGQMQSRLFPGTEEQTVQTIKVGRLATFLNPDDIRAPALLKIDVQGFELEALQGCSDVLARFDHIYVECSYVELYEGQSLAPAIIALLSDNGFVLVAEFNKIVDDALGAIQADLLFEKSA